MASASPVETKQRFGRLMERADGRDFPFYNGAPIEVAAWKWLVIILSCVAGFAALIFFPAATNVQSLVPRILSRPSPWPCSSSSRASTGNRSSTS